MRLMRIDWSSDTTIMLAASLVLLMIVSGLLSRFRPKKGRKPGGRRTNGAPMPDDYDLII